MRLLTPITKRLTAVMSIALILVGTIVSGHATAAHVNGLSNAVAAPCHHAMINDAQQAAGSSGSALDLCRQLCLNKIPDTAITATTAYPQTLVQSPEPTQSYGLVAKATPLEFQHAFDTTAPPERAHGSPTLRLQPLRI
jgi:hypothetical protein